MDEAEAGVIDLGRVLQARGDSTCAGTVQQDLTDFLNLLEHYDARDPQYDLGLVRLGNRLLIALGGGPDSFFGVFGQLNVDRVLDPVLSREEFMAAMERLGRQAERLAADRKVQRMVADLNRDVPDEERVPTPRRLASFCVGNQLMAPSDAAVGGDRSADRRQALVQVARLLADRVSQTDPSFEAVPWYRLAVGAAAAEVSRDAGLFAAAVERIGGPTAAVVAAGRVREHFHRLALQSAIDSQLRSLVIGDWPGAPADAESRLSS